MVHEVFVELESKCGWWSSAFPDRQAGRPWSGLAAFEAGRPLLVALAAGYGVYQIGDE